MAKENRFDAAGKASRKPLDAFAQLYPYFTISSIILIATVSIAIGVFDLAVRGLQTIGIPVIIASVALIFARVTEHRFDVSRHAPVGYSNSVVGRVLCRKKVTVSVFLLLFAVSVWLLTVGQYRPWTYFVVVSIIYALVAFQIFVREFDARIVLAEVPLLLLNQIYGVTLKYPYYYGWTDIFTHIERAKITYLTGHTVSSSIDVMYAKFPLYHIFVSEATYFLDLDMKTSLFLLTPIPYVMTAILLYYLLAGAVQDDRIPALATVLYSANTIVLFYGNYMITRTMAFVGFVFLLYIIYKRSNEGTASYTYLLVLMAYFTTIVHQVSMLQIILLLAVLYVCKRVVGFPRFLRLRTLLLITGIFLTYWVFFAWNFVVTLLDTFTRSEHYDEPVIQSLGTESANTNPLAEFARRIRHLVQNYVILFYAVLGIGIGLYEEYTKYARTLLLFSLVALGLFVPSPLHVIGQAMDLFRFDRFKLFVSPFVAMAMSVGVVSFFRKVNWSRNDAIRWAGTAFAFALVIAYVFTSVTHPLVASDSEDLPWSESKNYLTEPEVEGFNFVLQEVDLASTVRSDAHARKFFNRRAYNDRNRLYQRSYQSEVIYNVSNVSEYEGYTVFRNGKFREGGLKMHSGITLFPTAEAKRVLYDQFRMKNKIFSNGDVEVYYTNESSNG